jgi:2,4-diaminopentanoate dehydrogenase
MQQRLAVWGTGNMGSTAIRSALAFPGLGLSGIITSSQSKAGMDAADFVGLDTPTGVVATTDVDAVLADCDAVAYMASGDIRPEEAVNDIERCLRAGVHVVTPSLYSLYDPRSAPPEWVERLTLAAEEGGATLLVSGVDPGWGNDALAVIAAGLCTRIRSIHCQEIFDYSTYDQPHAVKVLCGFGGAMDEVPMMLLPSIPTMVWGGNIRLVGRGLGLDIDEITEEVQRRPARGVGRKSGGRERIVIDHITRGRRRRRPPGDHRRRPPAHAGDPRRRARRHQSRRRKHHRREPTARCDRLVGDAEAGNLRRSRRTASATAAARTRSPAVVLRLVERWTRDDRSRQPGSNDAA